MTKDEPTTSSVLPVMHRINLSRFHEIGFCLACEAEARHMYCFSGVVVVVVVVVVVGGGGVNFLCLGHFLGNYKG